MRSTMFDWLVLLRKNAVDSGSVYRPNVAQHTAESDAGLLLDFRTGADAWYGSGVMSSSMSMIIERQTARPIVWVECDHPAFFLEV